MKFFGKVFGLAAIIMLIGACNLPFGDDESEMENSGIDYTDYQTNAAIYVRNNTSENLVAFMGVLDESMKMGGIPGHAMNHAINKDSKLFNTTKDFPMILITAEQYETYKGNLDKLKEIPFTRVYVYYNATGDNTVRYEISGRLGGQYKLLVTNRSSMNVELRLGGIGGETIGYAPADMVSTTLYVSGGDMDIFPVFKRYNALRDTVDTMIPRAVDNYAWIFSRVFTDESPEQTIDVKEAIDNTNVNNRTLGVAYLAIQNQSSDAVHLIRDGAPVRSSTGVSYFMGNKTFSVDMAVLGAGTEQQTYALTQNISGYKIGPTGSEVAIVIKGTTDSNITLDTDKMYTVVVTGNQNLRNLKAEIDMGSAVAVEF